jgi:hypothetical protein
MTYKSVICTRVLQVDQPTDRRFTPHAVQLLESEVVSAFLLTRARVLLFPPVTRVRRADGPEKRSYYEGKIVP